MLGRGLARSIKFFVISLSQWRKWLTIGLFVITASGCASTASRPPIQRTQSNIAQLPDRPETQTNVAASPTNSNKFIEKRLRSEVMQWIGTPHQMGGGTRQGIDCSGFVQRMYRDIFQQQIPRSTGQQLRIGQPVSRTQIHTGDLVFFRPPNKVRHVGIYLGRQEFAHASTSKGVMISTLKDDYWRACYWTARRYAIDRN